MGRIANYLDLPLDQKSMIISMYLSVEFLSQLVIEQGETYKCLMKQNLGYVKTRLGTEVSEAKINEFLKEIFENDDCLNF